jgi:FAD/FMN-containing dehydrogenase
MSDLQAATRSGGETRLPAQAIEELRSGLRGAVVEPGAPGYDDARRIWNAMIDRRPALIARCLGAADVMAAMRFARAHDLLVAVRGGGHNIAGNAVCDGGLMIDLSPMKSVRVDPAARRARVEPGATLGDVDRESQAFGLATPLGINSTTGLAGLALGGGFGWLSRVHGLTADNLVSADVVTTRGTLVRASEAENPDLFWALRGGGGNFGIVTSFELALHPLGPEVLAGLIVFPFDEAKKVLTAYRDFAARIPDELAAWAVLRKAPPFPFLPAAVHGREIVAIAVFHAGEAGRGAALIEPVRRFGRVLGEHVGLQPYTSWQRTFDPLLAPGARNYWKSHNFTALPDGLLDVVIAYAGRLTSAHSEIFIGQLGGATSRVAPEATAYVHRDAQFVMNVHGRWETAAEDAAGIAWAREFFGAAAPFATGGVYVNFMTADEGDRVQAAYGANYERLRAVKERFDPENVLRLNQNIRPEAGARRP